MGGGGDCSSGDDGGADEAVLHALLPIDDNVVCSLPSLLDVVEAVYEGGGLRDAIHQGP